MHLFVIMDFKYLQISLNKIKVKEKRFSPDFSILFLDVYSLGFLDWQITQNMLIFVFSRSIWNNFCFAFEAANSHTIVFLFPINFVGKNVESQT